MVSKRSDERFLCQEVEPSLPANAQEDEFDNLATALLDVKLLEAVQLINMDLKQETRQVVLLGCGLDTRPHRHAYRPNHPHFVCLHSPNMCACILTLLHKPLQLSWHCKMGA